MIERVFISVGNKWFGVHPQETKTNQIISSSSLVSHSHSHFPHILPPHHHPNPTLPRLRQSLLPRTLLLPRRRYLLYRGYRGLRGTQCFRRAKSGNFLWRRRGCQKGRVLIDFLTL